MEQHQRFENRAGVSTRSVSVAGIPPRLRVAFFPLGAARTGLSGILPVVHDLLPQPPRNILPPIVLNSSRTGGAASHTTIGVCAGELPVRITNAAAGRWPDPMAQGGVRV